MPIVPCVSVAVEMVMAEQLVVKVMACVPWQPFASVARMVTLLLAGLVGVPLTTPVLALSARPAGRVPLATAYV